MILIGAGITIVPSAWAHEPLFEVHTTKDILKFCEFFYDEYTLFGVYHLAEQHPQYPNLRACEILYNNSAWHSDHWGREKVLISEIEKYLGDSNYVKERHIQKFNNIPSWMKNDAQRWIDGGKNIGMAHVIRTMLESELIILPIYYPREGICMFEKICLHEGNYVLLSTNKDDNTTTKKYSITEISDNKVTIQLKTLLFKGKILKGSEIQQYTATPDSEFTTFIDQNGECCLNFDFINQNSINLGPNITDNDLRLVAVTVIPFNGYTREVLIVEDSSSSHFQTIDKETGLVLLSTFVQGDDVKKVENTILLDTNIFERNSNLLYNDLVIPEWFKQNTKLFLDGNTPESEYLDAIKYLLINKFIKV